MRIIIYYVSECGCRVGAYASCIMKYFFFTAGHTFILPTHGNLIKCNFCSAWPRSSLTMQSCPLLPITRRPENGEIIRFPDCTCVTTLAVDGKIKHNVVERTTDNIGKELFYLSVRLNSVPTRFSVTPVRPVFSYIWSSTIIAIRPGGITRVSLFEPIIDMI